MSQRSPHRAWIEIDHQALLENLAAVRRLAGGGKQVIAVVKANAYGHGDVAAAGTLLDGGVERLAVATVPEALRLRAAHISAPILVLWGVGQPEAGPAVDAELELTVFDTRSLRLLEGAAEAVGRRASVHLKIDTGLGRQGSDPGAAVDIALGIARSRNLRLIGTYSHLAAPGEDDAFSEVQLVRMAQVLDGMRSAGVDPGLVHVSASGGILAGIGDFADAVRPGLALYGLVPDWAADRETGLRPVLAVAALPLRLFDLPAGAGVGYGSDSVPPPRLGSQRSGSATATGGRAATAPTAGRWFEGSGRRSSERSAWTG